MTDKCKTFVARWDHAMCSTCGEEHAPTPAHAPGIGIDAVDQDFRAAMEGPPGNRSAIKFYHETWPALIAEVRALRAAAEEREADMHARIRAGYDKTVADAWRAEVAKRDAEIADLRALVESQRHDYLDVCDAKVRALRAKLAEAKRLGRDACELAKAYADDAREYGGDTAAADAIAAALEAL